MSSANIWAVANLHVHASKQHRANDRAFQAESKKNERQIYYKKKKKDISPERTRTVVLHKTADNVDYK